jgi:hypothetical protein
MNKMDSVNIDHIELISGAHHASLATLNSEEAAAEEVAAPQTRMATESLTLAVVVVLA